MISYPFVSLTFATFRIAEFGSWACAHDLNAHARRKGATSKAGDWTCASICCGPVGPIGFIVGISTSFSAYAPSPEIRETERG